MHLKVGECSEVPFDVSCPSLRELIEGRTCDLCGIYHGTKKSLISHRSACRRSHPTMVSAQPAPADSNRKLRPQRLAARRQKERMVVWTTRLNDEHCDWFDENDVELVNELETQTGESVMPIFHIDDHMQNRWEDDE